MMRENSRLMRMTMKPMIISFIIVILFLPFLATHYGDKLVTMENNVGTLKLDSGEYTVQLSEDGKTVNIENIITACSLPCTQKVNNILFEISTSGQNIKFATVVVQMPINLPVVGNTIGWLGWYIIVSIPFVVLIRKFMKIYV